VIVEPPEVDANRPEPEQRNSVTALREHGTEIVEPLEETLRDAQSGSQPST
jgi:hypothetical protein